MLPRRVVLLAGNKSLWRLALFSSTHVKNVMIFREKNEGGY
jgi:hypothetical protein